jgi:hypothetical protein
MQPVQHIIISDETSTSEGRHWAFVINCIKKDGLWLVNKAQRDPEMTNEEVVKIVQRDLDASKTQFITGAAKPQKLKTKSPKKRIQQKSSWIHNRSYVITASVLFCLIIIGITIARRSKQ